MPLGVSLLEGAVGACLRDNNITILEVLFMKKKTQLRVCYFKWNFNFPK